MNSPSAACLTPLFNTSVFVFAASGGVLGCYVLSGCPPAAIAVFLAFTAAALFCLFRQSSVSTPERAGTPPVKLWFVPAALAAGLALGFVNAAEAKKPLSAGLPVEKIRALKGVLLDDPRALARGGMANLAAANSWAPLPGAAGQVRASAAGTAAVFFPDESIPRLKEFGRGGEIFVEGAFSAKPRYGRPVFNARSVHLVRPASRLEQFRTAARAFLVGRLNGMDKSGLAAALLLGSRENLDGELARSYRDAGLSHVLALSGMHLAFFSGLLALLLKRPLGKKPAALAGLLFIGVYVFIVGPQPSLVRAAVMYAMGALALLAGIPKITLAFLGAAFLLQTSFDPGSGFSVSFILSYTALAGILLLGEKIAFLFRGKIPKFLAEGLSASLGAFIATAPFVAAFFGVLRPAGIAAGLLVVPLTTVFMTVAQAALVFGGFPPAAAVLGRALFFLQSLTGNCVKAAASLPGITPPQGKTALAVIAILSAALAALVFYAENRFRRARSYLAPFD